MLLGQAPKKSLNWVCLRDTSRVLLICLVDRMYGSHLGPAVCGQKGPGQGAATAMSL